MAGAVSSGGIEDLLTAMAAAWATNRAGAIAALWDEAGFRWYKAEEVTQPFTRWDDALGYWRGNEALHEVVRLEFGKPSVAGLGDRWTAVLVPMRWDIRFRADAPVAFAGRAMGGDTLVSALAVRGDHGLRWAAWVEAPDSPVPLIRRLYEANARV